jgi:Na+-exporting ATPase
MVTKKVWIPARGTYSVSTSGDPVNPETGDLLHSTQSPSQVVEGQANDGVVAAHIDLLKDNVHLQDFLDVASLANLAHVHKSDDGWKARGDPTEIAIQVFASRFDWNRQRFTSGSDPEWFQVAEFPFDSDVKKMSVIFKHKTSKAMIFTKGAVERVLQSCTSVKWEKGDDLREMTDDYRRQVLENMEALASQGLRVLALANKEFLSSTDSSEEHNRASIEKDLTFQGLIGLYDPPRQESAGAVKECHEAGIAVHMLTGDHPGTARAIAAQVGILPSKMSSFAHNVVETMVMTASSFDKLTDDQIDALPTLPLVIARCSPSTKVRMIEALHRRKCFAAMTGDGVNDSPSLKRADVGIAMGQAGSDVAKDVSDIVLTDDNFASIINAIEEGRRMFDNIQKFVLHLLAENIAQACTLLIGLAFKDSSGLSVFPLAPVEILWVIMITSGTHTSLTILLPRLIKK